MTAPPKLFGSYGRKDAAPAFGRLGRVAPDTNGHDRRQSHSFGTRVRAPVPQLSLQRERIRGLYAELKILFGDVAFPDSPLPFALIDGEQTVLSIGVSASIHLDGETGMYIFADDDPRFSSLLMTASQDRLMDFVLSYLARGKDPAAPETSLAALDRCVGQPMCDVERALILATLRHCHGNRTHAARLLGISLRTLRNKLRGYWQHAFGDDTPDALSDLTQKPRDFGSRPRAKQSHVADASTR